MSGSLSLNSIQLAMALGAVGAFAEGATRVTHLVGTFAPRWVPQAYDIEGKIKSEFEERYNKIVAVSQTLQNVAPLIPATAHTASWLWNVQGVLVIKMITAVGVTILGVAIGVAAVWPIAGRLILRVSDGEQNAEREVLVTEVVCAAFKILNSAALVASGIKGRLNVPQGIFYGIILSFTIGMQGGYHALLALPGK